MFRWKRRGGLVVRSHKFYLQLRKKKIFYLTMESPITFFSLNVGMNASLAGLSTLIVAHNLDIIFLQEVRLATDQIELLLGGFGYQAAVNIDLENPSKPGTAIVWKKSLPVTNISSLVLCRMQVATQGQYMLLNIYAPSGSDKKHDRNIFFGQDVFTALKRDSTKISYFHSIKI